MILYCSHMKLCVNFWNLKTKMVWIAVKVDMEEAYDRNEWNFILKCLQEMGFHPTWNSWIINAYPQYPTH